MRHAYREERPVFFLLLLELCFRLVAADAGNVVLTVRVVRFVMGDVEFAHNDGRVEGTGRRRLRVTQVAPKQYILHRSSHSGAPSIAQLEERKTVMENIVS